MSIFKKISSSANNMFKKVDDSTNNMFKKVNSVAGKTISTIHDGLNTGLKGASGVMRQVSNKLEKYSPIIEAGAATFMPELALPVAGVLAGAKLFTDNTRGMIKQGRHENNQLAQTLSNKTNKVLDGAQQRYNSGSSSLSNNLQNRFTSGDEALQRINPPQYH